jgi:hypothetical protein
VRLEGTNAQPTFARGYTTNKLCAVSNRLLWMESALFASKTLSNDTGVFINQYTHFDCSWDNATILMAAWVKFASV